MNYRKYQITAFSYRENTEEAIDFQKHINNKIPKAISSCNYLICNIESSSNQLISDPPPYAFEVKIKVTKSNNDKSKNYITKELLDDLLKSDSQIEGIYCKRIYGYQEVF